MSRKEDQTKKRQVLLTGLRLLKLYLADKAAEIIESQTMEIKALTIEVQDAKVMLAKSEQAGRDLTRQLEISRRERKKLEAELSSLGPADINR